jgi:hypothetical protein
MEFPALRRRKGYTTLAVRQYAGHVAAERAFIGHGGSKGPHGRIALTMMKAAGAGARSR